MTQSIALIRSTAFVDSNTMARLASAYQIQIGRDFGPKWNLAPVEVSIYNPDDTLPEGALIINFTDNDPPMAGALGDHFQVGETPSGNVFCGPIMQNAGGILTGAYSIAATGSHEVLELLADPTAMLYMPRTLNNDAIAKEVCDPVQGLPYLIDGVSVSDFVTPYWFDDAATQARPMDQQLAVKAPFQLAPEGYCVKKNPDGTVVQVFGETPPPAWWLASRIRNRRRLK